jgi:hypothetical protein
LKQSSTFARRAHQPLQSKLIQAESSLPHLYAPPHDVRGELAPLSLSAESAKDSANVTSRFRARIAAHSTRAALASTLRYSASRNSCATSRTACEVTFERAAVCACLFSNFLHFRRIPSSSPSRIVECSSRRDRRRWGDEGEAAESVEGGQSLAQSQVATGAAPSREYESPLDCGRARLFGVANGRVRAEISASVITLPRALFGARRVVPSRLWLRAPPVSAS